MDLIDKIQEIATRMPKQLEHIQTEEATKTAFVMPFISALGYDIFNPLEVIPEFTADVGTKKGEKVDYAIKKDGQIIMLIECKWSGCNLDETHASQLYRYFSVTEARFGILTNGIRYKFYSDIEEPNKMDERPFFEFHLLDFEDGQIEEVKKFTKSAFQLEHILSSASTLKYTRAIKQIFAAEVVNPSRDFIRFFASQVYSGNITQSVQEQFAGIVRNAVTQYLRERINDRLKSALEREEQAESLEESLPEQNGEEGGGIVTTDEELEAYSIVKAILREVIDVNRIVMRDAKSYCGILFDDNNRKPICRLHFNSPSKKYIEFFSQKQGTKEPVENLNDIFPYADRLKATIQEYLSAE